MNRLPELDFLRGIAILLVLARHSYVVPASGEPIMHALHHVTTIGCRIGWIGVDLFFVLSGFLIAGIFFKSLKDTGSFQLKRFFIGRALKIYPSYFLLLAVTGGVLLLKIRHLQGIFQAAGVWEQFRVWLIPNAFFFQNYVDAIDSGYVWPIKITWSLAIEEHFYIGLPILLVVLRHFNQLAKLIPIGIALLVGCLILRCLRAGEPFSTMRHVVPTHLRIDSLFVGVMLAYLNHLRPERFQAMTAKWVRHLIIAAALISTAAIFDLGQSALMRTVGFTCISIGCAALLVGCLGSGVGRGYIGGLVGFIGQRSYSIYLWHSAVAWIASKWFWHNDVLKWTEWTAVYFLGSLSIGVIMFQLVEQPFLMLRKKITRAESPAIGAIPMQPH